ncbi:MAG: Tol-Pal system beta propeller repeat protein TolB [Legionellales bacterium]|nr:Tol-Pal system beta propeller repeat protein TolB [Legionellales bacterium]
MRKLVRLLSAIGLCLNLLVAHSALELELTKGVRGALPIAVVPFDNQTQDRNAVIVSQMITQDLQLSGQFKLIEGDVAKAYPQVNAGYWQRRGANNILVGKIQPVDANQYLVSFDLIDPVNQSRLLAHQQFQVDSNDLRRLGHHIADVVYQTLTGDPGIFSTQVAYVMVRHDRKKTAQYLLEISDIDGHNPRSLLRSSAPIMSPSWSPDGRQIAYVTFENKRAEIHLVTVATGQRRTITAYPGINGAPAWSPDGHQLAVVLSKSGAPKLYLVDVASQQLTQLTFGSAIDTEPSFTPDGKALMFTSNRGGSPQIYRLDLASKRIERITFTGNYNATPSMTRDGRQLVVLHRTANGKFNIAVQSLANGQLTPLTYTDFNESPSLAPNGKMVVYATQVKGKQILALASLDGQVQHRLPARIGEVQEPAWGPLQ